MGGLVSNTSNITICDLGEAFCEYLVSACNEVVNFLNINTNEVRYKIYDKEAENGFVTHLKSSGDRLAIGYSTGTILVYNLDPTDGEFEMLHKFQFHRTGISAIYFDDDNTTMYSGG